MSSRGIVLRAVVVMVVMSAVAPVQAGSVNNLMRWFGWGWSDGYHVHDTGRTHGVGFPCQRNTDERTQDVPQANAAPPRAARPAAPTPVPAPGSVQRGAKERAGSISAPNSQTITDRQPIGGVR